MFMVTDKYLLCLIAVICGSLYFIKAWNYTTIPILVTKLILKFRSKKDESFTSVFTRDEWEIWAAANMPEWLYKLTNCPTCQTPYISAVLTWFCFLKLNNYLASDAILGWLIAIGIISFFIAKSKAASPFPLPNSSVGNSLKTFTKSNTDNVTVNSYFSADVIPETKTVNLDAGVFSLKQAQELSESKLNLKLKAVKEEVEKIKSSSQDNYKLWQAEMGIESKTGPNGENIITGFNPVMLQTMKFFKPEEPCFFEGCDELRKQHAEELNKKGDDCPTCVKSELQRKYMILVKRALESQSLIK
jgi:hypothetical protein